MIAPLVVLAIPAFASGFGFVTKLSLTCPRKIMRPDSSCRDWRSQRRWLA